MLDSLWHNPVLRIVFGLAALSLAAIALAVSSSGRARLDRTTAIDSGHTKHAVVWAVGDGADGGPAAKRVVDLIERSRPDRFLYLGDVYESGTALEYAEGYGSTYGQLARITAPTPGNHEWPARNDGYDAYWRLASGRAVAPWYSFRLAGWQLLSLNSEAPHAPGSPQLEWLRARLGKPGDCRLAYWHRPRFSAGPHGDQPDVAPLWNGLRGRAALVLVGHDHDMQRFSPIQGITELVAGAGGHGLYPTSRHARLRFANSRDYGALRLDLSPGLARYRFVATDGRTLDAGRIRCKASASRRH
jgi:hypothetical protein